MFQYEYYLFVIKNGTFCKKWEYNRLHSFNMMHIYLYL